MKRLILILFVIGYSIAGSAQTVTKTKIEGSGERKIKKEVVAPSSTSYTMSSTTAHHAYGTTHHISKTHRRHYSSTYRKHHIKKHHHRHHAKKVKRSYKHGKAKAKYEY